MELLEVGGDGVGGGGGGGGSGSGDGGGVGGGKRGGEQASPEATREDRGDRPRWRCTTKFSINVDKNNEQSMLTKVKDTQKVLRTADFNVTKRGNIDEITYAYMIEVLKNADIKKEDSCRFHVSSPSNGKSQVLRYTLCNMQNFSHVKKSWRWNY
uniref:Uncharacterized protein n=1 Tax=Vespula pensylvanica TaxID=30213 RepID=A0A834NQ62_VESPE|nr:hypothetical protein H0235_012111 [Vespula pensylvanica]